MGEESRGVTALVMVKVLALHVALPVNLFVADNLPASLYARYVLWSTRTILIKEEARGTRLAYFVEHKLEGVGAGEEKHQHRNIGLGRRHI